MTLIQLKFIYHLLVLLRISSMLVAYSVLDIRAANPLDGDITMWDTSQSFRLSPDAI